ncbi:MAG: carbamoyltransferase HypF [Firmicutes bacterium]|nr:carbamoyltransferase HypF [Bacillota bacterium]
MKTLNLKVYGIVQGVGFRPFVSRNALALSVKGSVSNKGSYVDIYMQGENSEKLTDIILTSPPERACIFFWEKSYSDREEYTDFEISESEKEKGEIFVSPDIALCPTCEKELFDKNNKRYLHPFINCTQCGPRLTITDHMPYDRERTSMKSFPMCKECEREYYDPSSRRYDAQPVCCNSCGPKVYIIGKDIQDKEAISYARKALNQGKILALKGIGGFHICCDATNVQAVKRLRELKHRPSKPFALMFKDVREVKKHCHISPEEEKLLTGWQKPIILLEKKEDSPLPDILAPESKTLGTFLPYSPLHALLFSLPDHQNISPVLVMTSGNPHGAPICRNDEQALKYLSGFCDIILSHDREILIRADDTVTDFYRNKPYMIRRSRGFAPLPIVVNEKLKGDGIAIGGELKNTFCLAKKNLLYPSPYIGDIGDIRSFTVLEHSIKKMTELFEAEPKWIVCDKHPLYHTTRIAEDLSYKLDIPLVKLQHHYAHILSCMAENDFNSKVIGVAFDGTGYGDDGAIWGGEFFVCDRENYKRVASVMPFMQPGGDLSSKEGYRVAASLLEEENYRKNPHICDKNTYTVIQNMKKTGINTVLSTSCGRLFDAVSSILNIRQASTYEGDAANALMYYAQLCKDEKYLPFSPLTVEEDSLLRLNTTNFINRLSREEGDKISLSYRFHAVLSDMVAEACKIIREKYNINTCALSGGVFQNKLLLRLCVERLESKGFKVLIHSLIPPNDGGLCLGQAYYNLKEEI